MVQRSFWLNVVSISYYKLICDDPVIVGKISAVSLIHPEKEAGKWVVSTN